MISLFQDHISYIAHNSFEWTNIVAISAQFHKFTFISNFGFDCGTFNFQDNVKLDYYDTKTLRERRNNFLLLDLTLRL